MHPTLTLPRAPLAAAGASGGVDKPSLSAPPAPVVQSQLPPPVSPGNAGGPSGSGPRVSSEASRRDLLHAWVSGVPVVRATHSDMRNLTGPEVPPRSSAEPGAASGPARPARSGGHLPEEHRESPSGLITPGHLERLSPTPTGVLPGNRHLLLLDYNPDAPTWLSHDLRASGLVRSHYSGVQREWHDIIQISPKNGS